MDTMPSLARLSNDERSSGALGITNAVATLMSCNKLNTNSVKEVKVYYVAL